MALFSVLLESRRSFVRHAVWRMHHRQRIISDPDWDKPIDRIIIPVFALSMRLLRF